MRLKSLEIVGFKSFADPFRIDFRKGISSIVGPNGCGKSNVADAIRWVLGTQSPRQLRTDKMESVIFSGSTKRKQLGMAEVTLTFDNSGRSLNLDYDEVSVSRRLFRSGESEYSINGSRCRLMDITDLVVDRGLGSTGYWILESKMVRKILSSRPEDRRFLFDEAAGIVKYKIQRHRAGLKLDSTASDLNRLADIISEVESTCTGLKRQVSSYRRHQRVTDSIRALGEAMNLMESTALERKLQILREKLDETGGQVGRETAALAARSAFLAEARTEFGRVQTRLDQAHGTCADLDSQLASADREAAVTVEKMESAGVRIDENSARMARERERAELYKRDIEALAEEKAALDAPILELSRKSISFTEKTEKIRCDLDLARKKSEKARSSLALLEKKTDELQNRYLNGVRQEEADNQRLSWLAKTMEELSGRIEDRKKALQELDSKKASLAEEISCLEKRNAGNAENLLSLRDSLEEASNARAIIERETAVLLDKTKRFGEALKRADSPEAMSALIKPLSGMGKAVGAFLFGFNAAIPVEAADLEAPGNGALFAEIPPGGEPLLPEGAVTLDRCIESTPDSRVIEAVLSRGLLAPDRVTARKWIREGCTLPVVTVRGDLFRPEGFVRLGVEAESAGSLELGQILDEIGRELQDKKNKLAEADEKISVCKDEIAGIQKSSRETDDLARALERELAALESSMESSASSIELLKKEKKTAKEEHGTLSAGKEDSRGEECRKEIQRLQTERDSLTDGNKRIAEEISGLEGLLSETLRSSDGIEYALREKENRRREIENRVSLLCSEQDRIEELLEELSRSSSDSTGAVEKMKRRLEELAVSTGSLKDERGKAEEQRNSYAVERNELMESTAVLEREVQQIRDRLGRARSQMIELETQALSLTEKLEKLEAACTAEENPFLSLSSLELEEKLAEENGRLERIGPVNMLAVKEYEESSKRLEYLSEQKNDLQDARASLQRAIDEINREAADRFRETFDQVRENFQKMFCKLFGGGEGDILSVEGDDPLEGGIEIMARPLGKKLKNVIALSQGEKALTAVALLFSLYLVKPSPFCVLDELDAPFDDSNIDKFSALLRDFSADTQFIVITHNKRTMECSDVLYGITMAEEGVSSITSVNMEEMVKNS